MTERQEGAHRSMAELEDLLADAGASPADAGVLEMIVRRPGPGEREVLEEAELSAERGLVGDDWSRRGSSRSADGGPHPDMQLALMNSRVVDAIAGIRDRWPLAGDQLYVDLDFASDRLPAGTRLSIGQAVVEVTAEPHTGCGKFIARFGADAMRWVNSPEGRERNLRGVNARVLTNGTVRVGDPVQVIEPPPEKTSPSKGGEG